MGDIRWMIDGYEEWLAREGLPVVSGLAVDLLKVKTAPWPRIGANAAFVHLDARGDNCSTYLCELAPRSSGARLRHIFEEVVYVLEGRGSTVVELPGGARRSFEWQRGSLFSMPVNAPYQHFNASGEERALLACTSNLPLLMKLFRNERFLFESTFDFTERFGEERSFRGEGTFVPTREHRHIWETNFVPDLVTFDQVTDDPGRGSGARHINFQLAEGTLFSHMAEIPPGAYKKAHVHSDPAAPQYSEGIHIFQVTGEGYSLYWYTGEAPRRVDWRPGVLHSPPDRMWHQHFNVGDTPARYVTVDFGSLRYPVTHDRRRLWERRYSSRVEFQIEYADEDPSIRRLFEEERAKFVARREAAGR